MKEATLLPVVKDFDSLDVGGGRFFGVFEVFVEVHSKI